MPSTDKVKEMDADNQQERLLSPDFVAGLIVGEGCFTVTVARRAERLKNKHNFVMNAMFSIGMNDVETMEAVRRSFVSWGLAHYVERGTKRNGYRISAVGIKRVSRIIDFFLPYLTGKKLEAALAVQEFINLRLSKPQASPYGEDEFAIVERIRTSINAGAGVGKTFRSKLESSETSTLSAVL